METATKKLRPYQVRLVTDVCRAAEVARRRRSRGQALRDHAEMVCDALKGCLPRREWTSAMLLPDGGEAEIDAGFVGVLGAFEVYRGSARGHRMANLRLIVR